MAKQLLKFTVALLTAVAIVVVVRMFAFAVCTAPTSIGSEVRAGAKLWVNKLERGQDFKRGSLITFSLEEGDASPYSLIGHAQGLGKVVAVPGDTIVVRRQRYVIPYKCCDRCDLTDCCLYLVNTGLGERLVRRHQVTGKVSVLFQ